MLLLLCMLNRVVVSVMGLVLCIILQPFIVAGILRGWLRLILIGILRLYKPIVISILMMALFMILFPVALIIWGVIALRLINQGYACYRSAYSAQRDAGPGEMVVKVLCSGLPCWAIFGPLDCSSRPLYQEYGLQCRSVAVGIEGAEEDGDPDIGAPPEF